MRIKITLAIILIAATNLIGQTLPTSVTFKTPEVAAFNRFIETPVSQYTGVPNITIPIYEINIKGVNIPITLSYHAGGIRVDQEATWVGLGWSLSYGGEITRKARGIPDEYYFLPAASNNQLSVNGYMQLPGLGTQPDAPTSEARFNKITSAKNGNSDYMPDEFYYSALGYSGKFMFSQEQNKFILYPKEDIIVQDYPLQREYRKLTAFNLKLPDGNSVTFGDGATTKVDGRVAGSPANITNSWQIKSIKNNYNDSVVYDYESFNYRVFKLSGQQYRLHTDYLAGSNENQTFFDESTNYDSRLKSISFPGGRIEFVTQTRIDTYGMALKEVNVYNLNGLLVKKVQFNYGYFNGTEYDILSTINRSTPSYISTDFKTKRLRLESVDVVASGIKPVSYSFDYYSNSKIPSKYSFAQDHYGFYNGIPNMSLFGLIPKLDKSFDGGDRRVKPENSNLFALKSMTYPTGGKSEFIYENNTAGLWETPHELLSTYQDENFGMDQYEAISVSSYSRNTHHPEPTEVKNGDRYFRKRFTITGLVYPSFEKGWEVSTNFGISELEKTWPYLNNHVEFTLEKINTDGTRILIKTFNTASTIPRVGTDKSLLGITEGTYEMTVRIRYAANVNSAPDNQPYNLFFGIYWRQLDLSKNMLNVGGLRIKNINYYDSNNTLVKRKKFTYTNPTTNPSVPEFTSGRFVSLPQYIQYRLRTYTENAVRKTDWVTSFNSNSIIPLETTAGSYAGYELVDEYDEDLAAPVNNLRTAYHFSFDRPYFSQYYPSNNSWLWEAKEWSRGKLLDKQFYKNGKVLRNETYDYYYWSPHLYGESVEDGAEEINTDFISIQGMYPFDNQSDDFYNISNSVGNNCVYFYYAPFDNHVISTSGRPLPGGTGISSGSCDYYTKVPYFKHNTVFDKIKSKKITSYDNPDLPSINIENYYYEKSPLHYQLTKTSNSTSSGDSVSIFNKYPLDLNLSGTAEEGRLKLIGTHQINTLLSQSRIKNSSDLTSKTDYRVDQHTGLVVPDVSKTNTLSGADEIRNLYHRYDDKGNILSLSKAGGSSINYIWSYNGQYPIAEIKNTDYSTVESLLGKQNIINFNNLRPNKTQVDAFLTILKTLPNVEISSYVYEPLVGIKSQTDPKGMTIYYHYDELQRLKFIKDQNGNIIKSYSYNYRTPATTTESPGQNITNYYARVEIENISTNVYGNFKDFKANVYIRLYSDAACTIRYTLLKSTNIIMNDLSLFGEDADPENNAYSYDIASGASEYSLGEIFVRGEVLYVDPNGEGAGYTHRYSIVPPLGANYFAAPTIGANY